MLIYFHKSSFNSISTVLPWKPINHPRPPPRIRNLLPAPVRKKRKIDSALSTALSEAEERILSLTEQIYILSKQVSTLSNPHIERFSLQRFQGSNEDI